jgi:small GTP-binding protein
MAEKVFIFGLDRAGKTIITKYITKGIIDETFRPTLAFTPQNLVFPEVKIQLWDTPGQIKFRKQWLKNVARSKLLVFVLDVNDPVRFDEAKQELTDFIKGLYNMDAPLIIVYHKMDLPVAQENIGKAKKMLDVEKITIQDIHQIETSIKDVGTLDTLKQMMHDLLV